jgi:hypothetical protein
VTISFNPAAHPKQLGHHAAVGTKAVLREQRHIDARRAVPRGPNASGPR